MQKFDPFEYIREVYRVPAKKGQRVRYQKRIGTITKAKGPYIYIMLDGDLKPTGPYHPTSDIEYLEITK
jgi:hypothetical protein